MTTTYSNSITLGNILTIGAMVVSVTLAYGRLTAADETINLRLAAQEAVANAHGARISSTEGALNAQAVNNATLTAQLTALRESLSELKTSQAETNRLLRNLVPQGSKP